MLSNFLICHRKNNLFITQSLKQQNSARKNYFEIYLHKILTIILHSIRVFQVTLFQGF